MRNTNEQSHVQVRERRLLEMSCVCGDTYERDFYSHDTTGDLESVAEKIAAFRKRHTECAKDPA